MTELTCGPISAVSSTKLDKLQLGAICPNHFSRDIYSYFLQLKNKSAYIVCISKKDRASSRLADNRKDNLL